MVRTDVLLKALRQTSAFFQLFFLDFRNALISNSAAVVYRYNKGLKAEPIPRLRGLNLASVVFGNRLSGPYAQYSAFGEWL